MEEALANSAKSASMDSYELDLDVCCVKSSKSPLENMRLDAEVWLLLPSGPNKMLVGEEGALGLLLHKSLPVGFNTGELAVDLDIVI